MLIIKLEPIYIRRGGDLFKVFMLSYKLTFDNINDTKSSQEIDILEKLFINTALS